MTLSAHEFNNVTQTKCAHCGQPFCIENNQVECWRGSDGKFFAVSFAAMTLRRLNSNPGQERHKLRRCGGSRRWVAAEPRPAAPGACQTSVNLFGEKR
jgi:hypothetical protein